MILFSDVTFQGALVFFSFHVFRVFSYDNEGKQLSDHPIPLSRFVHMSDDAPVMFPVSTAHNRTFHIDHLPCLMPSAEVPASVGTVSTSCNQNWPFPSTSFSISASFFLFQATAKAFQSLIGSPSIFQFLASLNSINSSAEKETIFFSKKNS